MALGTLWYAQQASAKILQGALASGTATTGIGCTTQALDQIIVNATTQTSGSGSIRTWTGRVTNVSIKGGSRDFKAKDTLGISQLAEHGRPEVITAEFSLIFENAQGAEYLSGIPFITTVTVTDYTIGGTTFTSTFSRWQYGEKSTSVADRPSLAVLFKLTDAVVSASNKTVNCLLNNAYLTDRESSLAADGSVEEKWTIKCLAQDYYEEDNFANSGT